MYNAEIKFRFIEEKESETTLPKNYLNRLFNHTESFEERLEKDVSNFTFNEITDMYKAMRIFSLSMISVYNSLLSGYTQWSLEQNLVKDSQNHFLELNFDTFDNCVNKLMLDKKIISKETVLEWTEEFANPCDSFAVLALFEGIKGQNFCELTKIKWSDFDGNTVHLYTGRTITVSDTLVKFARAASEEQFYYSVTNTMSRRVAFKNENLIIKNYPNVEDSIDEFQEGRRIYRKFYRLFSYLEMPWLRINDITDSGKIDYINTRSKELGISAKEFLYSPYIEEVNTKFDCKIVQTLFLRKFSKYLV